jgi:predicted phosphate transport protein (TIGR00153 family)
MVKVMESVAPLKGLFEAVLAHDMDRVAEIQGEIARHEDEADDLKHELRLHLPRSLFMPVERRDVLEVLNMQDRIANRAKDIAGLIRGRRMTIPETLAEDFAKFVNRAVDACKQAHRIIDELDELVETGFSGAEVERVQDMIKELDRIEKDTDVIQVRVRAKLFEIESDLPPVEVMFLYRIIDWTGDLGDRAQRVGSRLQIMLAK